MATYLSARSYTLGDPDSWVKGKRVPFTPDDLALLSTRCGDYEYQRKQLSIVSKLKGIEEEIVDGTG